MNDSKLKHLTQEEKQEKVQDFTSSVLRRHGTVGGSKSLFVNSREAFYTKAGVGQGDRSSPGLLDTASNNGLNMTMGNMTTTSGMLNQTASDYKTLK